MVRHYATKLKLVRFRETFDSSYRGIYDTIGLYGTGYPTESSMTNPMTLTITEQVTQLLRAGIRSGRWRGALPGKIVLARDLGVSPMTVTRALDSLEEAGVLEPALAGRRRKILTSLKETTKHFRVGIFPFSNLSRSSALLLEIQNILAQHQFAVVPAKKSLVACRMEINLIADVVSNTDCDAWVVHAAPVRVLEWFAKQGKPVFGFFGEPKGLAVAGTGPDRLQAISEAVNTLTALNHHRIVLIDYTYHGDPVEQKCAHDFLSSLRAHGIATGPYNHPDWSLSAEGLQRCITRLFAHTPPTALIVETPLLFHSLLSLLAQRRICVPRDVSMVCMDYDRTFEMFTPSVAHMKWDFTNSAKALNRWLGSLECGTVKRTQSFPKARFITGGTIGPARRERANAGK